MKSAANSQPIDCFAKLQSIQQEQIVGHWSSLTPPQKKHLLQQIKALDLPFFRLQREMLHKERHFLEGYKPLQNYSMAGNASDQAIGKERVREGKVALLVLAGGQGSRLSCEGPKGCIEVTSIKKKTLFQFLAEKVQAAGLQVGRELEIGIMTSPINHKESQTFFAQHDFFGLNRERVAFFMQHMWPLLDRQGNLFLESPDQIAQGPNGNGGLFRHFVQSGLWEKWHQKGIEQVNVIPIDNPLADPFDYESIGFQNRLDSEIVIKATLRKSPDENVGLMVEVEGQPRVIEYFEMPLNERNQIEEEGQLKYRLAHLGLYTLTMPLIWQLSHLHLPIHMAAKEAKRWDSHTERVERIKAWKFEEFIFDILPHASKSSLLLYPRESCFAPLKNLEGEDSIESVRRSLLLNDRAVFQKMTGSEPPQGAQFELSPQFYYPTTELMNKWKGKSFPKEEYIDD